MASGLRSADLGEGLIHGVELKYEPFQLHYGLSGLLKRYRWRHGDIDLDIAFIEHGYELGAQVRHQEHGPCECPKGAQNHNLPMVYRAFQ